MSYLEDARIDAATFAFIVSSGDSAFSNTVTDSLKSPAFVSVTLPSSFSVAVKPPFSNEAATELTEMFLLFDFQYFLSVFSRFSFFIIASTIANGFIVFTRTINPARVNARIMQTVINFGSLLKKSGNNARTPKITGNCASAMTNAKQSRAVSRFFF